VADLLGSDLIHRYSQVDVGTCCLPCLAAGQERGIGTCVVTGAVAIGFRFIEIQSTNDLEVVA
jgi:hypothetical protein